jgi:hypothetical protein
MSLSRPPLDGGYLFCNNGFLVAVLCIAAKVMVASFLHGLLCLLYTSDSLIVVGNRDFNLTFEGKIKYLCQFKLCGFTSGYIDCFEDITELLKDNVKC